MMHAHPGTAARSGCEQTTSQLDMVRRLAVIGYRWDRDADMSRRVESIPIWRKTAVRWLRRNRLAARILAPLALTGSYDAAGRPIPWMTYGLIRFLESRLARRHTVFEYGAGNSTLWWAERVGRVTTCEWDPRWFDEIAKRVPANVETILAVDIDSGAYAATILASEDLFHVVVIDGRDRVACARHAVKRLTADGVLLWDNTDRPRYQPGLDELQLAGFRRLDFYGLGPVNASPEQSSLLYRPDNCLGI